jgi:lysyl-tRNA synthetase class 2
MSKTGKSCRKEILISRHLILKGIRQWFFSEGFVEIQPPVVSRTPLPESSVDLFEIEDGRRPSYLLPSPELYLKPLLSLGLERFFSVGPAFRRGERGRHHLPQFTILEWYRANSDYSSLMKDCQALISSAFKALQNPPGDLSINYNGGRLIDLEPPYEIMTVEEAFEKFAGWNPVYEKNEQRFEEDLVSKVEPALSKIGAVFLKDFPSWAASLSKLKETDSNVCERVELYIAGLELANGFSELLDPEEQRARFEAENRKRHSLGMKILPAPAEFLSALERCPPSAGMALGIDRLVMLLTGASGISETNIGYL